MLSILKRSVHILLLVAVVVCGADNSSARPYPDRAETLRNLEKFSRVYQKIVSSYVEEEDSDELIDAAIEAMLDQLDPFSQFMDEDMLEDLMVKTKQEFGGLGIVISVRGVYPTVVSPIEDTPAARLGIRGGDKIVEIEGESTEGWSVEDAVDKLRGPKGTTVNIGIQRFGVDEVIPFSIVRDIIPVDTVPYYFMREGNIGYIRCTNFGEHTATEIEDALHDLESQGLHGLVLDLRSNPGGLLDSAREVSDLFLAAGQVIVSTKGRAEERVNEYYANNNEDYAVDYPLVVLINEYSASASEIVAGAIQDWDRGLVVGRNSFGKGSVQSIFPVSDREALKLTTAKYYTPSGRCIHKDENNHRFGEGDDPAEYELEEAPENPIAELDSLPLFSTLKLNRPVRGGGGIMPDIIIEGRKISHAVLDLERRSTFFNFAVELLGEGEVDLSFDVDDDLVARFHEYVSDLELDDLTEEDPVEDQDLTEEDPADDEDLAEEDLVDDDEYIRMAIRREVMYKQFGAKEAARVTLARDKVLQETLELLRRAPTLDNLLAVSVEDLAEDTR